MCWSIEWTEWKIEYDNQVYTNNYNEHVAVMEVNVKWYGEREKRTKRTLSLVGICTHCHKRGNVSSILKKE